LSKVGVAYLSVARPVFFSSPSEACSKSSGHHDRSQLSDTLNEKVAHRGTGMKHEILSKNGHVERENATNYYHYHASGGGDERAFQKQRTQSSPTLCIENQFKENLRFLVVFDFPAIHRHQHLAR
jgi:hypothetical protein